MSGALSALRPREASIFACIADTLVAPEPPLPPVHRTDAAFALDASLAAGPSLTRAGLRVLLLALELAPLALGAGARLRRLPREQRAQVLDRLSRHPAGAAALQALRGLAHLNYYGDDAVMRGLGYDPDAVVARGAALRESEGRW